MTLGDVGGYFHLPIEKASERLRLCPTVVKKICRKGGVGRWPYRKVNSLSFLSVLELIFALSKIFHFSQISVFCRFNVSRERSWN